MTQPDRRILLLVHPRRLQAAVLAEQVVELLGCHGVAVVRAPEDQVLADRYGDAVPPVADAGGCELVVVLGGDGTILRGAELARGTGVPVLGINLGHVGFLAELEAADLEAAVERIVRRDYDVHERMTLECTLHHEGRVAWSTWALNEVAVEKAAPERMIELTVEIDGRPLSTWGCDGVVASTPTGSTAYAFSGGGPVVWPDVEAIVVVPISAHALFARPMVLGPCTPLAFDFLARGEGHAVVWCDGRRSVDLPPGARLEVRRSPEPVRLAGFVDTPFADRLVEKFDLPIAGWRGDRDDDAGRSRGSAPGPAREA